MYNQLFFFIYYTGIDDKHGKGLQKSFPLEDWINILCTSDGDSDDEDAFWCNTLARQWKNNSGNKTNFEYWKPVSTIQKYLNLVQKSDLETLGAEPDVMWGPLNGQCQTVLVSNCEIPYVCERTVLDPNPKTQYFLTHQVFQRILVETVDCPDLKSVVLEEKTYDALCAKSYMEAQYLDLLNLPPIHRDLFAEYGKFSKFY